MGQKVSPKGLRIGVNREWDAQWYASKNEVADLLLEDQKIRKYLAKTYAKAQVSRVVIERVKGTDKDIVNITLYTAKPGVVIGRDAETKNNTIKELEYLTKKSIHMNVNEVKKPELDATLVARSIAEQLEARASFRRVQKIAQQRAMKAGAKGIKTLISGRLGGAEIARGEGYSVGQVPLQTLRADLDYAWDEAHTTYGKLGIKVWIYKGEVLNLKKAQEKKAAEEKAAREERTKRFNNKTNGKKPAGNRANGARRPRTEHNEKSSEGGK
jgi:small subunit ribosomal protein S3